MEKLIYNIKSRKRVDLSQGIKLNISKDKLWEIVTSPGHLKKYHPYCRSHEGPSITEVGSKDVAIFYNGKVLNREIIDFKIKSFYKIQITSDDDNDTRVQFSIQEEGPNCCYFYIAIETNAYRNIPRPIWYLIARFQALPLYGKYFYSQLKGLEFYVNTGEKVRKNQFGSHRIISP